MNGVQNNMLQINLLFGDKASAQFKETAKALESSSERLANKLKSIGQVGAVAFSALSVAIGGAISTYQDQEKAEKRLEQIATQVTGATKAQIQEFKNLASATQQLGVVGDEVLISGQSQLASFTKSSEVVKELTDDLADLAVATYGTNVSQEQSIQTANLLGKALQGQLGALTKTGILVSKDYEKAFKKANTEQERTAILSKIIQDNYGGVNKAMRETSQGGLQALKNSYGDLLEVIGKAFVPLLNKIVEKLIPIVDAFGAWASEHETLISVIGSLALGISGLMMALGGVGMAIGPIVKGFGIVKVAFSALMPIFSAIASAIAAIGLPIAILIGALTALGLAYGTNLFGFRDAVNSVFGKVKEYLLDLWQYLKKVFGEIWQTIKETRDQVAPILLPIWESFKNGLAQALNEVIIPLIKTFASIFGEVWKASIRVLGEVIQFIKNFFTGNRKGAFQNLQNIANIWKGALLNIFGAFRENLGGIFSAIANRIRGIWQNLREGLKNICSNAINRIQNQISKVLGAISTAKEKVSNLASSAWEGTKNLAGRAWRAVGGRASGGEVIAGQLYRINELGTEYFRPAVNGRMERQNQTSGGLTLNFGGVVINNGMDLAEFEERIRKVIYNEQQRANLGYF